MLGSEDEVVAVDDLEFLFGGSTVGFIDQTAN